MSNDTKIVNKIRKIFEDDSEEVIEEEYPQEALPLGTYVRAQKHTRLGIISDAFYSGEDLDNKRIIVYTILFLPEPFIAPSAPDYRNRSQLYVANEYECK